MELARKMINNSRTSHSGGNPPLDNPFMSPYCSGIGSKKDISNSKGYINGFSLNNFLINKGDSIADLSLFK